MKGTNVTHIVIKVEDAQKYLNPVELQNLYCTLGTIEEGRKRDRKPTNEYLICNQDEPYAKEVHEVILRGESRK